MNELDPHATKDALSSPGLATYLYVGGISMLAAVTSFFESDKPYSWRTIAAHVTSSGFAGMLTGFACQALAVSTMWSFVAVGVAAHMGTPALIKLAMKLKVVRKMLDDNTISGKETE